MKKKEDFFFSKMFLRAKNEGNFSEVNSTLSLVRAFAPTYMNVRSYKLLSTSIVKKRWIEMISSGIRYFPHAAFELGEEFESFVRRVCTYVRARYYTPT